MPRSVSRPTCGPISSSGSAESKLHGFTEADYLRLLGAMNESARRLLSAYTRDEATPLLVRLCLDQPRFMFLGLRALLKAGLNCSAG